MDLSEYIKKIHYLSFQMGNEIFGVEIGYVLEVLSEPQITMIPNAPKNIEGVINYRGTVVPVYDLRKKLNIDIAPAKNTDAYLILNIPIVETYQLVAIITTKVYEVFESLETKVSAINEISKAYDVSLLSGQVKHNDNFIMILDSNEIINEKEIKV